MATKFVAKYEILKDLVGKTLLITGGTGSFGSAILQRFLRLCQEL
jgi:FlaA1/EpsC-like NDP-sugar epimerase